MGAVHLSGEVRSHELRLTHSTGLAGSEVILAETLLTNAT
jgi:hypothetical protein